jgi:ferredoxin
VLLLPVAAGAVERFPPPDFESGHTLPETTQPPPRQLWREYADVGVLAVALALSAYLVYVRRSRRGVAWLTAGSLFYFGYLREGCVCAVGATQNVTLALFDPSYAPPFPVVLFFFLPLLSTLFFGRTFCAAVCPLGAVQDVVLVRPIRVPRWLDHSLRNLAYVYLGLAVLFAATGAAFVICRYDPFVAFFRLHGSATMLLLGGSLLLIGLFVGRPYCRYLCPYGVLLGLLSRFSWQRISITPTKCVQCRLCEESCPYGAIRVPNAERGVPERAALRRRVAVLLLALPLAILTFGWIGARLGAPFSHLHPTVALAARVQAEDSGEVEGSTDASQAFRGTGRPPAELHAEALEIQRRFGWGAALFGGFVGLSIVARLLTVSVWRRRRDYEADAGRCLACARCFSYCPEEQERLNAEAGSRAV